jgi:hypothetical protein
MATPTRPPRIVFFGPPHAGKTGLIHAFLRRAGVDYQDAAAVAPAGRSEVVPYVAPAAAVQTAVVLTDVDGRAAGEIIARPDRLRAARGRVAAAAAGEVRSADAIVLTLDAAATDGGLLELFRDFTRFLDGLEQTRAFGREVGGLPVFLTLTKCDKLWLPGDDPREWEARVQTRLRNVRREFEEYLADETSYSADPYTFGSIDLHVAATALQFPKDPRFAPLGDAPYGVDELFDEASAAAVAFRDRADASGRRLRWTVAGAGGLAGAMLAGLLAVAAFGPNADEDRLARRLNAYHDREGTAAARLADRAFRRNRAELEAIRGDFAFEQLPEEERQFVADRLREFEAYQQYRERFGPGQPGPAEVRSRTELDALDAALAGDLAPPAEYAAAWADTEAVRLWSKWRTDADLLRQAEAALNEWYRGLIRRGTVMLLGPAVDSRWRQDLGALLREAETPPVKPAAAIPGSPAVPVRRGAPLTYAGVFEFDRVEQAAADWAETRGRLLDLRGLADALGLTAGPAVPPAVLDLPEPTADPAASLPLAADRLRQLAEVYGRTAENAGGWAVSRFPDPVRGELRRALLRSFDAGVRHVRQLVLDRLGRGSPGFAETPAAWAPVARWLGEDANARAWGTLLRQIARWADPEVPTEDPVAELAAFLRRAEFPASLPAVEVTIPDDLRDTRVTPAGPLVLAHAGRENRFRPDGDPRRDGPATVYRFVPDGWDGRLTVRPGDAVSVSLPVRAGGTEFLIEWASGRSAVYQFERLRREPTVRRAGPAGIAERATGVRLAAVPDAGLPAVPVLLPDVTAGR